MMIFTWLIVIALIAGGVWFFTTGPGKGTFGSGPRPGGGADRSAEEILKERYARGEIEKDEYERKLADLRGTG